MKKKGLPLLIGVVALALLTVLYVMLVKHNTETEEEDTTVKVFDLDAGDVAAVRFTLDGEEETFTLEDDTWSLASDAAFEVDSSKMSTLLDTVTAMAATRTLDNVTDLSEYGLDEPVQTLVLTMAGGTVYTICWGSSNDITGDDYVYIKEKENVVYTVDYSILDALGETLEDYRAEEETATEDSSQEEETTEKETSEAVTEETTENETQE